MTVRVEYYYDHESGNWGFSVPSLHITGGGSATREEAEEEARTAILFAIEGDGDSDVLADGDIGYFHIAIEKAVVPQPV